VASFEKRHSRSHSIASSTLKKTNSAQTNDQQAACRGVVGVLTVTSHLENQHQSGVVRSAGRANNHTSAKQRKSSKRDGDAHRHRINANHRRRHQHRRHGGSGKNNGGITYGGGMASNSRKTISNHLGIG